MCGKGVAVISNEWPMRWFRIEPELSVRMDEFCTQHKIKKQTFLNGAISEYLDNQISYQEFLNERKKNGRNSK